MSQEPNTLMSTADIFSQYQETFEDAKKKSNEESGSRIPYLRFSKDGSYSIRILPLAPVLNSEGKYVLDRKGYEYPLKELVLKIDDPNSNANGKAKSSFVSVCNAKYAFPDIQCDLIDKYVAVACNQYADDEDLCKQLKSTSFNGGLKWDSRRCMYVYDLNNRAEGLKILPLSYSQYKDLEERKLKLWEKLSKGKNTGCPISSVGSTYPLEITRKSEGKRTEYSINIDTIAPLDPLTEAELNDLLNAPRLPEVIYRYTRFHLEATIVFLQQMDARLRIDVMNSQEIADCIEQIKLCLPADDHSHFTMGGSASNTSASAASDTLTLDKLWDEMERLSDEGLDDKTEEGQALRTLIKEYIEENDLNIRISRLKSNADILNEIEGLQSDNNSADAEEEEDEPDTSVNDIEEEEEEDEPAAEVPRSRTERNDDTNEPAAGTERRTIRPARRRL